MKEKGIVRFLKTKTWVKTDLTYEIGYGSGRPGSATSPSVVSLGILTLCSPMTPSNHHRRSVPGLPRRCPSCLQALPLPASYIATTHRPPLTMELGGLTSWGNADKTIFNAETGQVVSMFWAMLMKELISDDDMSALLHRADKWFKDRGAWWTFVLDTNVPLERKANILKLDLRST